MPMPKSNEELWKLYENQPATNQRKQLPTATEIRQKAEVEKRKLMTDPTCAPPPSGMAGPGTPIKRSWKDADAFDREVSEGTRVDIESAQSSDHVFVKSRLSGEIYKLTETQAVERGLYESGDHCRGRMQISLDPVEPQVHILHQGQALCHFDNRRPSEWPKGHEQVSFDHIRNTPRDQPCGATCYDCIEAAAHLLEP